MTACGARRAVSSRARPDFDADIRPLPSVGNPFAGESLYGYLLRMALKNRLGGIAPILDLLGLQQPSELRPEHIPLIARLFDARPADVLSTMNVEFWSEGQRLTRIQGEFVRRTYLIRSRRPRVCPDCLVEFGFCRQVWDLTFFVSCPLHGRLLLDCCPGCGRCLSWMRPSLDACRCGRSLLENVDLPCPPEGVALLCLHIWSVLDCSPSPRCAPLAMPEPDGHRAQRILGGLSLDGFLRLVWILGFDEHLPSRKARLQPGVRAATAWVQTAMRRLDALMSRRDASVPDLSATDVVHLKTLAGEATTHADRRCALSVIEAAVRVRPKRHARVPPANQLSFDFD